MISITYIESKEILTALAMVAKFVTVNELTLAKFVP